jgi:lipopolysaccharide transport system permease protein
VYAQITVREAGRTNDRYWRDLWMARQLIWTLALRDISVRYKQSAIGVSWALFRPLVTMVAFTIVFERIAQLPSDGNLPYSLMVLAGIVPWMFFSTSLSDATNSLISNSNLIEKVFFPRLALPISSLSNALLELLISTALLLIVMLVYGVEFRWTLALLPAFGALALFGSVGLGIWCAAINVRYRDIRFIVPFLIQLGLYVTPIGFSSQLVPDQWKPIFYLNPMAIVVDGFRWSINPGSISLYWPGLISSTLICSALLYVGLRYFRRTERMFADFI